MPGPSRLYKAAKGIPQPTVNDPYNGLQKQQFEDNFNANQTVKRAIIVRSQFTLGRRYKLELEVFDKSMKEKDKQELLDDKMWRGYLGKIKQIDEKLGMHHKVMSMLIQSAVFGRSALHAPFSGSFTFSDGTTADKMPQFVHILSSKLLNKVFIDANTWEITGIIYSQQGGMISGDTQNNQIPIDELIYFTRSDFHITPRTLFYGRSDIEPISHVAELQRRLDEVDFKEIGAQMWAGFIVAKINTRNPQIAANIVDQLKPGASVGVPAGQVEFEALEIPKDLPGLVQLRESNEMAIIRGIGVPSIVMNFENITNRATADDVLLAWQKSTLEYERTWLKETLQPQWYDRLLSNISGVPIDELPVKVKMKFDLVTINDWADIAGAAMQLWDRQLIDREKMYTLLGFEDVIVKFKKDDPKALKDVFEPQNQDSEDDKKKDKEGKLIELADKILSASDDVTSKFPIEGREKYKAKMQEVGYVEDEDFAKV